LAASLAQSKNRKVDISSMFVDGHEASMEEPGSISGQVYL